MREEWLLLSKLAVQHCVSSQVLQQTGQKFVQLPCELEVYFARIWIQTIWCTNITSDISIQSLKESFHGKSSEFRWFHKGNFFPLQLVSSLIKWRVYTREFWVGRQSSCRWILHNTPAARLLWQGMAEMQCLSSTDTSCFFHVFVSQIYIQEHNRNSFWELDLVKFDWNNANTTTEMEKIKVIISP